MKDKKRILVHGLAGYTKGGIETFVLGMAEHMSNDIIFDFVIEDDANKLNSKMPGEGNTYFIAPKRKMLDNIICWNKLLNKRKGKNDTVYFNWYSMAWLFPAIIARIKGYRVIIHAHNNNLHNCGFLQRSLHSINRQVQKYMKITRLTNSDLSAKFFFGDKLATMIYNAIDITRFSFNEKVRNSLREKLNLQNKHVYGFAGRLAYQKNPLFLIDVFYEIKKIDKEAAFLICGGGDMYEETKQKAVNLGLNVIFLGAVPNVQDYYQAMDVFILPSLFEGLGIVLIEAQCSGLPCLASGKVIPKSAQVTKLLDFVQLDDNPDVWAIESVKKANASHSRHQYSRLLSKTRFNINVEAETLKKIIEIENID